MKAFKAGMFVGALVAILGMMLGPWIVLGGVVLWVAWSIIARILKGGARIARRFARGAARDPFGGDPAWGRSPWHS